MVARYQSDSLTWGLLILILGIVLQMHYLRPEWHILNNLWKFWPVLLIVMGSNRLIRYFSAKRPSGPESS